MVATRRLGKSELIISSSAAAVLISWSTLGSPFSVPPLETSKTLESQHGSNEMKPPLAILHFCPRKTVATSTQAFLKSVHEELDDRDGFDYINFASKGFKQLRNSALKCLDKCGNGADTNCINVCGKKDAVRGDVQHLKKILNGKARKG
jgi:hypothetical protein